MTKRYFNESSPKEPIKNFSDIFKGMKKDEAIERLKGIKCGMKSTSCPDQLALALESDN